MHILQESRADNTLIYADVGPNTLNKSQKFRVTDDSSCRVQYAAINHDAKAPVSKLPLLTEDDLSSGNVNLRSLC